MNALDLNFVNRFASYKVWTEDGRDYLIETNRGNIFIVGKNMYFCKKYGSH